MHHGTILYDFEINLVGRYLQEPAKQPDYRRGRPHASFLTNVWLDGGFAARFLGEYPGVTVIE